MEMITYVSARANPFAYHLDTPIDLPAGRPYHASARSMDLRVNFHSQCKGMEFYELRSAGAEWGTKLKLVKESTTSHDPLCVVAWVPGIPGETQIKPLTQHGACQHGCQL